MIEIPDDLMPLGVVHNEARREELMVRIAQLYFERRRLQVDAVLTPDSPGATDRAIEIEELTAVLDGLTDGALTKGERRR